MRSDYNLKKIKFRKESEVEPRRSLHVWLSRHLSNTKSKRKEVRWDKHDEAEEVQTSYTSSSSLPVFFRTHRVSISLHCLPVSEEEETQGFSGTRNPKVDSRRDTTTETVDRWILGGRVITWVTSESVRETTPEKEVQSFYTNT